MKFNLFFLLFFAFLNVSNAQFQHSIYIAPGVNLYQHVAGHQSYQTLKNHKFINSWQSSVGYRLLYRLNRFAFYATSELKYSKLKFNQFYPSINFSGEIINAEGSIGLSYRIYKKFAFGLDYKQIHELSASGSFFDQIFDLDDDYFAYTFSLQYQFSKHFETGLHFCAPFGNQYSKYSDDANLSSLLFHKIYLNNLNLRLYYNF
ncbi:MAG: hypothetical protein IPH96_09075 [Saprospiraceae bacterium]|nr:hypothetical protein [Saprospiraceae bacterium]